jgi:hypothetical protein
MFWLVATGESMDLKKSRSVSNPAKIDWSKVDNPDHVFQRFPSRRSVVYGTKGLVSSSNASATGAGLEILRWGGNAGTLKILRHCPRQTAKFGVLTHWHEITVQRTQLSLLPRR